MMKFNRNNLLLYAVTERCGGSADELMIKIEQALRGGATCIQLREKQLDTAAFTKEAVEARRLCRRYDTPLIINDNVSVALESGADGVHVGQGDMSVSEIRALAGRGFIIGATAKTVEQARLAESGGADYLGVGAVFPSPTKQNALRITKETLAEICSSVSVPAVAIGGINADNIVELRGCGIAGVAVVSAVFSADDVTRAALELRTLAQSVVGSANN